jgi:hypothetical protein
MAIASPKTKEELAREFKINPEVTRQPAKNYIRNTGMKKS